MKDDAKAWAPATRVGDPDGVEKLRWSAWHQMLSPDLQHSLTVSKIVSFLSCYLPFLRRIWKPRSVSIEAGKFLRNLHPSIPSTHLLVLRT